MSFSTILSAAVDGLQAELIRVEADVSNGLPVFHMVGYLSSEVREAGERVRTAIRNSGYEYPPKRTVVNLSPATVRKRGASFDLPIAAAILTALGQIPPGSAKDCLMIGELGLNGSVGKVPGILPMVMEAARQVKMEGRPNDLLERIADDPMFGLDHEKVRKLVEPSDYVGRAPQQVTEFLSRLIDPLLEEYKSEIGVQIDLKV